MQHTSAPEPIPTHTARLRVGLSAIVTVFAGLTVAGALWREFLCDDAFITFRYVSNAVDGHGLVWNPPPFAPVEGYTSLAWALVLWACWEWFDWLPIHAANWLAIGCGTALTLVTARAACRLQAPDGARANAVIVGMVLLATVSNHTFLQWCTSGLETSLFNLLFVSWVLLPLRWSKSPGAGALASWATLAALATLTRPDGLLLCAATGAVALLFAVRGELRLSTLLAGLSPLSIVAAQFGWRLSFYGEWLPNTYYAKVTAPWPEAGWRYLQCFAFENGTWVVLPMTLAWLIARRTPGTSPTALLLAKLAVILTVFAHAGYYIVRVGGDHFAFRVLSHLVPLTSLAVGALSMRLRPWARVAALSALTLASGTAWVRIGLTNPSVPPAYDPLADHVPSWLRPVARWHDRQRLWLHLQMCCIDFRLGRPIEQTLALAPERRRRQRQADDMLVTTASAAGLIGWALPDVAILDVLGLNDWVTARTPTSSSGQSLIPAPLLTAALARADTDGDGRKTRAELEGALAGAIGAESAQGLTRLLLILFAVDEDDALSASEAAEVGPYFANLRLMAHERHAPADYIADFDPNLTFDGAEVTIREREQPLTRDRIVEIERKWRAHITARRDQRAN